MISDEEIVELERLEREATAGPWTNEQFEDEDDLWWICGARGSTGHPREIPYVGGHYTRSDQQCAVAARNALPRLIADHKAMRAVVEALAAKRSCDCPTDPCDGDCVWQAARRLVCLDAPTGGGGN